jgi:hypothetical protein
MISLVRACWCPSGQGELAERGAESIRVIVRGPYIPQVTVVLQRSPAEHALNQDGLQVSDDEHLVAGPGETRWAWLSVADVIIRRAGTVAWSPSGVYARFPGCLVAAILDDRECVVGTADGGLARMRPLLAGTDATVVPYVSVIHAWLVAGRSLASLHAARLEAGPMARPGSVLVDVPGVRPARSLA